MEPETVNQPTRLGKLLEKFLSDSKCGNCHIRFRAGGRDWCNRCIEVYRRAQGLSGQKIVRILTDLVGEKYLGATIEQVDEPYRALLSDAGTEDVFLWGNIGVGKTFAMAAILRKYVCAGYSCERINFDTFCSKVRSTMNNNSKLTEYALIKQMSDVDKLFIDDVGLRSKQETDFAYVTFYSILNKRQERSLQTLITTNKSIEQLSASFDSRIASRLSSAVNINMTGKDRRRG